MKAQSTRRGGRHLANERGAKEYEPVEEIPYIGLKYRGRLIEELAEKHPNSLISVAEFLGIGLKELTDRYK